MRRDIAILLALLAVTPVAARGATDTGARVRLRMDAGWRFHKGEIESERAPLGTLITGWKTRLDTRKGEDVAEMTADDTDVSSWADLSAGDPLRTTTGFAWYRTTLPAAAAKDPATAALDFTGIDDNATIYLNGKKLYVQQGWGQPFTVPVAGAWRTDAPNTLAVLVENTDGAGGLDPAVRIVQETPMPAPARAEFDDSAWQTVQVPHDFVVATDPTPTADGSHGFRPPDTAWYRKSFRVPAGSQGKTLWIDFDGVFSDAKVWLNGQYLGEHRSGYMSGRFDITKAVRLDGPNELSVHVDARKFEGWWYEGGGIYRHVWLNAAAPVHVAPWGTLVTSTVADVTGPKPSATLTIHTTVANDTGASQHVTVSSSILDPSGHQVAALLTATDLSAGASDLNQTIAIPDALLWSLENPRLYTLRSQVLNGTSVVDTYDTPFGIRTIRFDKDKGFFLNEKPVKLKGTCNHQDFAGIGVALPDNVLEWRIARLKEMGSNAYRCSHNPVAAELLDACDRLGMLVMDETRHLGDTYSGKTSAGTPASELTDFSEMIRRDRNHPSVIMWSICNEEPLQGTKDGARIATAMKARAYELDGSRPVSAAMNGGHGGDGFTTVLDLEGFNYGPGAYDGFHQRYPNLPMYGSETASTVSTRGIYANDKERGYVSAYDVNFPGWAQTAEDAWQPLAERDFMAGGFVWTGFDYKGEPTPYGWPCINSHFGILDECGFAKDNFYYYKAWWGDKPVVHILPHWNWAGKEGQEIDVWAHTAAEKVELFLNGKSLGAKEMPRYRHVEWKVPYAPGKLEARAMTGGKVVATDVVETTGPAAALKLAPITKVIQADGEQVAIIPVQVVDAQGRVVPTANNLIRFEVTGAGTFAGVGNGDPSTHESDVLPQRSAFNGLALVLAKAGTKPGVITITARAEGLKPATITVRTLPTTKTDL